MHDCFLLLIRGGAVFEEVSLFYAIIGNEVLHEQGKLKVLILYHAL